LGIRREVGREAVLYLCLRSRGDTVIFLHIWIFKYFCSYHSFSFFLHVTKLWLCNVYFSCVRISLLTLLSNLYRTVRSEDPTELNIYKYGLADNWYKYREEAFYETVKDWYERNEILFIDDRGNY
jgi:hypothetical protein